MTSSTIPALMRKISSLNIQTEVVDEEDITNLRRSSSHDDLVNPPSPPAKPNRQLTLRKQRSFRQCPKVIPPPNTLPELVPWSNGPFSDDIEKELLKKRKNSSSKSPSSRLSNVFRTLFKDRPRASSMPDMSHSILKKGLAQPPKYHYLRKQTSFKEQVDVQYFDRNRLVSRGSLKLKGEEKYLRKQRAMEQQKASSADESDSGSSVNGGGSAQGTATESVSKVKSVFLYKTQQPEDGRVKKMLSLIIEINRSYRRHKALVKAMSNGKAMLVLVSEDLDSVEEIRYIEKILLPLRIDPHSVTACVHQNGVLVIEAEVDE
ncbi:hypothetical protein CAPTEDRAFT_208370 [Capitella teleta]|uniref:Uncharacterized protein n=1 Tax=Capitella teleta TaxID=283909 RepID=R7TTI9_CAPTE|nr:hypothetical protein CAPTEDRAFT_208370 [Capitella teleta]|eukprot:ELT94786.1 hypothetical protein CAPTEDRAFT_208370 [Capitella teleta]